jgi:hypothetical protein
MEPHIPEDFDRLKQFFRTNVIALASKFKELVIAFDSIDQLSQLYNALHDFSWLPLGEKLPSHVRFILTTVPVIEQTHQHVFDGLKLLCRNGKNTVRTLTVSALKYVERAKRAQNELAAAPH